MSENQVPDTLLAVPSQSPGGLGALVSGHFGHCDIFSLVSIKNGEAVDISILPNVPHEHGGCMAPVNMLASKGVKCMVAGGMGMRPLLGFNEVGIQVFSVGNATTVNEALEAFQKGQLNVFTMESTCQGH